MFRARHQLPRLGTRPVAPLSSWKSVRGVAKGPYNVHAHWTPEKLSLSDRYPLSAHVDALLNPSVIERDDQTSITKRRPPAAVRPIVRPRAGVHLRNQIVSPDLCDDILKYIAPSLEQHKGCDILDINPGACLWSQKLHEYLQPRSHILLEPSHALFKSWIDPLINAPGSKYKLIEGNTLHLETLRDVVNTETFPHQTYKKSEDPNGQKLNPTLLVTGSLMWDPVLPGFAFDSMAKQLYNHFAAAPWSNDILNVFGPVRTLLWVGADDFTRQIAKSMSHVQRASSILELTTKMELVATSKRGEKVSGRGALAREPQYEIQSTMQALRRGKEAGMVIPERRRNVSHQFAERLEEVTGGSGVISSLAMQELLIEERQKGVDVTYYAGKGLVSVVDTRAELTRHNPEYFVAPVLPAVSPIKEPPTMDAPDRDRNRQYRTERAAVRGIINTKIIIEEVCDLNERMMRLEWKVLKMKPGPKKDAALKELDVMDEEWHQKVGRITKNFSTAPMNEYDDRMSLRCSPQPRLQWDSRPYDALTIDADEIWPRNATSLISTVPIPRPTCPEYPDFHEWILDFTTGLYQDPAKPLPEALNIMQHSLSDIIKDCPSLTDPAKGGRLNLNHFRVRMLTREMLEELTKAYMEWPFKWEGTNHSVYFRNRKLPGKKW